MTCRKRSESLNKKKTTPLTAEEQAQLDTLRREADVLMFRKGYAAVLLERRGYRLPTLQELEQSSRFVPQQRVTGARSRHLG